MEFWGTIGPACADAGLLKEMVREGMTGLRMNLSHGMLKDHMDWIAMIHDAGVQDLLIDLQGPELRIGTLPEPVTLEEGEHFFLKDAGILAEAVGADSPRAVPCPSALIRALEPGQEVLLDDGKILAHVIRADSHTAECAVARGGVLKSRKSIAAPGLSIDMPTLTGEDLENLRAAAACGVTCVMLPFVRGIGDIRNLKKALAGYGAAHIRIYAKIENMAGVHALDEFISEVDHVVIARGDLGNDMPLWELPGCQKRIAARCRQAQTPFMVVTQMLDSMHTRAVPTRAEVCDIYNAVMDGASSIMLTGETAAGSYPLEAMRYLIRTAGYAESDREALRRQQQCRNWKQG